MPKVVSSDKKKLKKKYHDQPRYPAITYGYEGDLKKAFGRQLVKTGTELSKKMVEIVKTKK